MRRPTTFEESGAFTDRIHLGPSGSGILNNLTFAVKDLIDIAGHVTGCGNPTWRDTHPPATAHAVCVELLLASGARCVGKTITDELAFSLLGENFFYGTPLNPRSPDRVPGGSSCGSASAVACGLADFALGTDTGGSVRVPAANCGLWGLRPTHGLAPTAGVAPLSPSLDTVGVLASTAGILADASIVLLSIPSLVEAKPRNIYLIREAFTACDLNVREALEPVVRKLRDIFGARIREISMREIDGVAQSTDLMNWFEVYRILQRVEAENSLGAWVVSARPQLGALIAESIELTRTQDRGLAAGIILRREDYCRRMKTFLGENDLLCIPTAPAPAPLKGSIRKREQSPDEYYPRALSLTSIAGIARSPQVSMPVADASGAPLGLSLIARTGEDAFLLSVCRSLAGMIQQPA